MTRAKGKAIKKTTTLGVIGNRVIVNTILVGGNTIKELSSLINGLPEDMAVALETTPTLRSLSPLTAL